MYFSEEQKKFQEHLNELILSDWNDALSQYYECDRLGLTYWERLYSCSAHICHIPYYVFLKSYNTIVAVYDVNNHVLYDLLRYEYGYTATSAQHITKFKNKIRYMYDLLPCEIEVLRYYDI